MTTDLYQIRLIEWPKLSQDPTSNYSLPQMTNHEPLYKILSILEISLPQFHKPSINSKTIEKVLG
jgi:hypothetical protein